MNKTTMRFQFEDSISKLPRGEAVMEGDRELTVRVDPKSKMAWPAIDVAWMAEMVARFLCDVEPDQRIYPIREDPEHNLTMTVTFHEPEPEPISKGLAGMAFIA